MRVIPVTSDIELRTLSHLDAPMIFETIERNRAWLRRWLPWVKDDYSIDDAFCFLEEADAGNHDKTSLTMGIWASGVFCGAIGLHKIIPLHRNTSIGYWIDEAFSGRGIATSACRAIVSEGFLSYDLNRIEIRCAAENHRSCAIPQRLGFEEEGLLREAEWLYDHWVDLRLFAMLKRTWENRS